MLNFHLFGAGRFFNALLSVIGNGGSLVVAESLWVAESFWEEETFLVAKSF